MKGVPFLSKMVHKRISTSFCPCYFQLSYKEKHHEELDNEMI